VDALIIAGASAAVLAALLLTLVPWRRVEATALGFSWRRSIDISEQVWEHVKDSRSPPPGDARNVRIGHKMVWVTRSQGARSAGFSSTTSELVRVYSYEVPRWRHARTVRAAGEGQAGVDWPSYTLGGTERAGQHAESYKATFQDAKGKKRTWRMHEATWRSLNAGATYSLRPNGLGFVRKAGPPALPGNGTSTRAPG
jgi:hypothetical protein